MWVGGVILSAFVGGCRPVPLTGEDLGLFVVDGVLVENGCAPGLSPRNPLQFRVALRRDRGTLTWRVPDGAPAFGTVASDGAFRLRTETVVPAWPADPAAMVRGCSLQQVETVEGRLSSETLLDGGLSDAAIVHDADVEDAAGASDDGGFEADAAAAPSDAGRADAGVDRPVSFQASSRIELVPVLGSDCSALLLVQGGSFPTLPCTARYELTAHRQN